MSGGPELCPGTWKWVDHCRSSYQAPPSSWKQQLGGGYRRWGSGSWSVLLSNTSHCLHDLCNLAHVPEALRFLLMKWSHRYSGCQSGYSKLSIACASSTSNRASPEWLPGFVVSVVHVFWLKNPPKVYIPGSLEIFLSQGSTVLPIYYSIAKESKLCESKQLITGLYFLYACFWTQLSNPTVKEVGFTLFKGQGFDKSYA